MGSDWDEIDGRNGEPPDLLPRILLIGAIAVVGVLIWVQLSDRAEKAKSQQAAAEPATAPVTDSANESPRVEITGVLQVPGAVAPGERAYGPDGTTYVGVYECEVNGQRVVSDRPCGPGATTRVLEVDPATAPPPPVPVYRPSPSTSSAAPRAEYSDSAADAAGHEGQCRIVDQEIDQLNARMRQGYGSQEGEWLRAQWHRLQDRRRELRCGR
jgi:hypothetical protein